MTGISLVHTICAKREEGCTKSHVLSVPLRSKVFRQCSYLQLKNQVLHRLKFWKEKELQAHCITEKNMVQVLGDLIICM